MNKISSIPRVVQIWLYIGLVMVFFQVVIGGVTRLTDSGLSITEWAVIQGTIPPLNEGEWNIAFDKYKVAAKKQYESLHGDMTLSEFKIIFFWEYFHRLWARLMGFVFIFPFFFFLWKKWLPSWLVKRLGLVILLAAMAAVVGWIMVASGLHDDTRTWVSAYKLITHLGIATTLFAYLYWTCLRASQPISADSEHVKLKRFAWGLFFLLIVQILFGGLMAGMRAGLVHPYWPFFVQGDRLLQILSATHESGLDGIVDYEPALFVKGLVQVLHRFTAYLLFGLVISFSLKALKANISVRLKKGLYFLIGVLICQFLLGILAVINSIGHIPIFYGALHQAVALILLGSLLFVNFQFRKGGN